MPEHVTVAAVHATPASIPPLRSALADALPGSTLWNIIDDRLAPDADATGGELTPALRDRMLTLVRHGVDGGAHAVVIACSMYGEVGDIAGRLFSTPIFTSDADMFAQILRAAPTRVAVLASLRGSAADTSARLAAAFACRQHDAEVVPVFCSGAAEAAARDDTPGLVAALAAGFDSTAGGFDLVCIAQYSLSPAAGELANKLALPVIAPTTAAAKAIARRLEQS
ncbi:hypothetical protein [Mycolicibacterium goodii]|uniref:Asp/Glu racemase n=1 Tax=Mycolicibacterium goodii TaxID=134601 RepID=A0A0K0XAC1_MYCGD|nr:hypothetical protein AFA91_23265 [Mycolicibacterium goodii]